MISPSVEVYERHRRLPVVHSKPAGLAGALEPQKESVRVRCWNKLEQAAAEQRRDLPGADDLLDHGQVGGGEQQAVWPTRDHIENQTRTRHLPGCESKDERDLWRDRRSASGSRPMTTR